MTARLSPSEPFSQSGRKMKFQTEELAEAAFALLFAALDDDAYPDPRPELSAAFRREAFRAVGEEP